MEIIGHRGARGLAPENSLLGVRRAMALDVDMIEVDIRVKNGELVLSHDQVIRSENYATLEDLLITVEGNFPLNLEIKELAVVKYLKKELQGYKGRIIFSSFEFKILQAVKKVFPKAELAVLEKWSGVRAIAEATLLDTDRVHINQQWLWSGFVKSMKHRGFKLYAYTVNSRDRADELKEWGIDGIFTDYPSLFTD
ncbi:glycerophosphodiester phosphodiesterase [Candidatus Saccharibacteria bacterium]|nr:glycerophosphodiester phosphodiesterase [Candidatus Saccharibacteria bacterium]